MITNTGKKIITKYLIGQVPSYASYIALGCGPSPLLALPTGTELDSYKSTIQNKTSLDFEMFRVPVTSRGYIVENGVQKVVLTAQLPAEERYEISEIGLYPAESNPVAVGFDSKTLYSFNASEVWESHISYGSVEAKAIIPKITDTLAPSGSSVINPKVLIANSGTIGTPSGTGPYIATISALSSTTNVTIGDTIVATDAGGSLGSGTVTVTSVDSTSITISASSTITAGEISAIYNNNMKIFQANASNSTLSVDVRSKRFERPRFFDNAIFVRGDLCVIPDDYGVSEDPTTKRNHIHLNNLNLDLSKNSPLDEIRIAFSVVNKDSANTVVPSKAKLIVEFSDVDGMSFSTGVSAKAKITVSSDMTNNRYFVASIPIKDLSTTTFSWTSIKSVKIYSSIEVSGVGVGPSDYYIALDAIKVENVSSVSSAYGLTGYTVVVNTELDASNEPYESPIIKESNTSNYVEFRFVADVV